MPPAAASDAGVRRQNLSRVRCINDAVKSGLVSDDTSHRLFPSRDRHGGGGKMRAVYRSRRRRDIVATVRRKYTARALYNRKRGSALLAGNDHATHTTVRLPVR